MITFRQFLLLEGGKATAEHGTVRATKSDIEAALKFVSKTTGLQVQQLKDHLLGSTAQTLAGLKKDSGDIDIAMIDDEHRKDYEEKMTKAIGIPPRKTGANVLSYAVPSTGDRRVQVDFMFVPDIEYAKFSYHSEPGSKFKGAVRNLLIYSLVLNTPEVGKDVRIKDKDGNEVARASRSWQLDTGLKRVFKIAPLRKDGKGRTKSMVKATPEEVQAVAKEYGYTGTISKEEDNIISPSKIATMLLGSGGTEKDLKTSAENLISIIKKKRKDHAQIFKDALSDIDRQKIFEDDEEGRARYLELTK